MLGGWEEVGRLPESGGFEPSDIVFIALYALLLLMAEEPVPWVYGCPYACDCRGRVVRLTPRPLEDVFLFLTAVALLDPGLDPDGVFAATEGCRRGRG